MDQDVRRGLFVHVAIVVTISLIAFTIASYVVIALVAWVGFPETFQLLTRPNLNEHLEKIPIAFWWTAIASLSLLAIPAGFATHWLLPHVGKSHVWIVAMLLFLMNFQQFLGQQGTLKWASLVMMVLIPGGFMTGAKFGSRPFGTAKCQTDGQ